jgi:hypothetical protein
MTLRKRPGHEKRLFPQGVELGYGLLPPPIVILSAAKDLPYF